MELIHTCYRITDIDRSVAFYEALGFEERARMPIREEAINVFMGLPGDGDRLELTYNFGVDSYELGTAYGHIAITVDDMDGALERLSAQGIEPERPKYQVREGGLVHRVRAGPGRLSGGADRTQPEVAATAFLLELRAYFAWRKYAAQPRIKAAVGFGRLRFGPARGGRDGPTEAHLRASSGGPDRASGSTAVKSASSFGRSACFALKSRTISGRPYGIPSSVHSITST